MRRKILFLIGLLGLPLFLYAQNQLKIGQWREHLPFRSGTFITQSPEKIFYATEWAILEWDKTDRSAKVYTKINSLSDVGPRVIRYHQPLDILIIAYQNGNIDLLGPNGAINLPFIKLFDDPGDKTIYDIVLDGNAAFLTTGFGISKLDLERSEFDFTTFTGNLRVNSMARWNNQYYAATPEGVYRVSVNGNNLADFGTWELLDTNDGFPDALGANALVPFNEKLYLGMEDGLYHYQDNLLTPVFLPDSASIRFLSAEGENLLLGLARTDYPGNFRPDQVIRFDENENQTVYRQGCVDVTLHAIEDQFGNIWFADQFTGYRIAGPDGTGCQSIDLNSPQVGFINQLEVDGDDIWLTSGGILPDQNYLQRPWGFYGRVDGDWKIYNTFNVPALSELRDFYDVAIHPENGIIYASAFFEGLVEYDRESFLVFNDSNSSLQNAVGDASRTRCAGLDFDQDNNLWVCNHVAPKPVSVLKNDGSWKSFDVPTTSTRYLDVMVDQNNLKWFILATSSTEPILVLDTGEDLDDTSDDRTRIINTSNSELPNGDVISMATDLDGNVWVGTTEGAVVFECGTGIFDESCRGVRRIVEQDGIPAFLLETETINTIAVDGANRKWFGTNNGIFVQSADGEEQIAYFNTSNSPLFDDEIIDIAINQQSGEVFVGTASGLMSFLGEAVEGGVVNASNVVVYPNPVRPEYEGPIAIKGLARDANVKITDISGKLVYETTALGGQAIWNGRDYTGRRAASGVYLVFSTAVRNTFNPDTAIARILFLN
jgi:hypothetical protein